MSHLRNTGYVAAWASELASGAHLRRVLLAWDAGGVRTRRVLAKLIEAEQAALTNG